MKIHYRIVDIDSRDAFNPERKDHDGKPPLKVGDIITTKEINIDCDNFKGVFEKVGKDAFEGFALQFKLRACYIAP